MLVRLRPGQRIVPPFAADAARAIDEPAVDDEPAAAARAEDHAEHTARTRTRAVDGLGEREAIGVVGKPHRAAERLGKIHVERAAVEPGRVRVLHAPRGR